jgi:hypothetical protein
MFLKTSFFYLLLIFDNNLSTSKYNQINVTSNPNQAYHSIYFGALTAAHFSITSKSSARLNAAIHTIKILTPIPTGPDSCINGTVYQPVADHNKLARYIRAIAHVAAITHILNFSVTTIILDAYNHNITKKIAKVNQTDCITIPGSTAS